MIGYLWNIVLILYHQSEIWKQGPVKSQPLPIQTFTDFQDPCFRLLIKLSQFQTDKTVVDFLDICRLLRKFYTLLYTTCKIVHFCLKWNNSDVDCESLSGGIKISQSMLLFHGIYDISSSYPIPRYPDFTTESSIQKIIHNKCTIKI